MTAKHVKAPLCAFYGAQGPINTRRFSPASSTCWDDS
jgi:hypothetical protein